jgi:transcriptional regulator with XRE-family HTH domain
MSNNSRLIVAANVKSLRQHRNITQSQLARRSGLSQSAISGLENPAGKSPSISSLDAIADALSVSTPALLFTGVPAESLASSELRDLISAFFGASDEGRQVILRTAHNEARYARLPPTQPDSA